MSGARAVAVRVLQRVAEQGAYASLALDAELSRAGLDRRGAALATAVVYGTLRVLPLCDRRIAAHLTRPAARLDPVARAALRAGAHQLLHLASGAPHAVVDETVAAVRAERGPRVAGFVNAVLRKLAAERPPVPRLPARMVLPDALHRKLAAALTPERLDALLSMGAEPPPLCLRVDGGDREALASELGRARPTARFELGTVAPDALLCWGAGDPRALPGYVEGRFAVQEEGAQLVALAVGACEGERVADACAGHGGKTSVLVRAVGARGHVAAIDRDERKLARIAPELARLALPGDACVTHAVDLSVGLGTLEAASFHRVLVDAPCSGLGTLRRRPELCLRFDAARLGELRTLQRAIVERAWQLVRPGGTLTFAVCSPLEEESLAGLVLPAAEPADLPITAGMPGVDADGVTRIGPWLCAATASSPDAYQIQVWRKGPA